MKTKFEALSEFLELENSDDILDKGDNLFSHGKCEYLVLTDTEADEGYADYIESSIWAFNAPFLVPFIKACDRLSDKETELFIEMIQYAQENEYDGCNNMILALVGDRLNDLVKEAISCDGRGHFLSSYDGYEHEEGDYFIYRVN